MINKLWHSRTTYHDLEKWLPVVDELRFTGCNRCVLSCSPNSLLVINGIAHLIDPESCGSEEHCIAPCPEHAISMKWVTHHGSLHRGLWQIQ